MVPVGVGFPLVPATAMFTINTCPVMMLDADGVTVTGGITPIVLSHIGVEIGAFASNTMVAWLVICVPNASPCFGSTVKRTLPSPCGGLTSGGRKPTAGLVGGFPVAGSIEMNFQVRSP